MPEVTSRGTSSESSSFRGFANLTLQNHQFASPSPLVIMRVGHRLQSSFLLVLNSIAS